MKNQARFYQLRTTKVPQRFVGDGLEEQVSNLTGHDLKNEEDTARQEFKADADINVIVGRFNLGQLSVNNQRPLSFGERDFDLDLQRGLNALREVNEAYWHMDPDLKEVFPTSQEFISALGDGSFRTIVDEYMQGKAPPPAAPPPAAPPPTA